MRKTVFYSWQSDLPNSINRGFIERALEKACKALADDPTVESAPRVDKDTADVPGSPDIAETILEKIEAADAVVADVSIVNRGGKPELLSPNPNVLIETGYASHALGWKRVLLIQNTVFGGPEDLPFDLKMHRPIMYQLAENQQEKQAVRNSLQKQFENSLRAIFSMKEKEPQILSEAVFSFEGAGMNQSFAEINIKNHGELAKAIDFSFPTGIDVRSYPSNIFSKGNSGKLILESKTNQIKLRMPFKLQYVNEHDQRVQQQGVVDFEDQNIVNFETATLVQERKVEIELLEGHVSVVGADNSPTQLTLHIRLFLTTNDEIVFPFHKCRAQIEFMNLSQHIELFDSVELRNDESTENRSGRLVVSNPSQLIFIGGKKNLDHYVFPIPAVPLRCSAVLVDTDGVPRRIEMKMIESTPQAGGEIQRWNLQPV